MCSRAAALEGESVTATVSAVDGCKTDLSRSSATDWAEVGRRAGEAPSEAAAASPT